MIEFCDICHVRKEVKYKRNPLKYRKYKIKKKYYICSSCDRVLSEVD